MYTPKPYEQNDLNRRLEFIDRYSFATIVSTDDDGLPLASHVPVSLFREHDPPTLFGHVARANPIWRTFQPDRPLLIIFQGPHAYITPRWYEQPDVPTWNYAAVHLYGKPRIVEDRDHLLSCVTRQVQKYEGASDDAFRVEEVLPESLQKDLRGIVGFEITPDRIEASYKLSQKLKPTGFGNVISGLLDRQDAESLGVAQLMTEARPADIPRIELRSGVTLRRATREDVGPIVKLLADDPLGSQRDNPVGELPSAYLDGFERIDLDPNQELLVMESCGKTIGTLQLTTIPGLSRQGGTRLLVEAVRIGSDFRGQGLGHVLFEWVIQHARTRGCRMVQLTTDKSRNDAHRFYERLGFVASHEGMKLSL
jgi:transcriptional regulator